MQGGVAGASGHLPGARERGRSEPASSPPDPKGWKRVARSVVRTIVRTGERFGEIEASRLAAAFAFYSLLAFFPLVLLAVTVFGFWLGGGDAVRTRFLDSFGTGLTPDARRIVEDVLTSLQERQSARGFAAVAGILSLGWAASGVFSELDTALNRVFRVPSPPPAENTWRSLLAAARERVSAFFTMVMVGGLFVASLVASTVVDVLSQRVDDILPLPVIYGLLEKAASWAVLSLSIAALFRVSVHRRVPFKYHLAGAAVSALFFTILKSLFALYLARFTSYALYGAVGAVLALGFWIYLTALGLFAGAQLSQALAEPEAPPAGKPTPKEEVEAKALGASSAKR